MTRVRRVAKPELAQRLVDLNGSHSGYVRNVEGQLTAISGGKSVTTTFLNRVINGRAGAPSWMVLGLVRIAEDNIDLSRDAAFDLAADWFTNEEV